MKGDEQNWGLIMFSRCLLNSRIVRKLKTIARPSFEILHILPRNVGLRNLDCIAIEKVVSLSHPLSLLVPLSLCLSTHSKTCASSCRHTHLLRRTCAWNPFPPPLSVRNKNSLLLSIRCNIALLYVYTRVRLANC